MHMMLVHVEFIVYAIFFVGGLIRENENQIPS